MRRRHVTIVLMIAALSVVGLAPGTASSAPNTRQNFSITNDINAEGGPVVATGVIDAVGEDIVISEQEDQFVFPAGTLTVIHVPSRGHEHFNERTCTGSFHETGVYVITEGTGEYEGVTGGGRYRATGRFEDACGPEDPTGTFTISARGTIDLP